MLWTLSSNYFLSHFFYKLVIQFQVDICILDTIYLGPGVGPESGALAILGEIVMIVTMT